MFINHCGLIHQLTLPPHSLLFPFTTHLVLSFYFYERPWKIKKKIPDSKVLICWKSGLQEDQLHARP